MAMPRRPPRHHNLNSSAGLSTAASALILSADRPFAGGRPNWPPLEARSFAPHLPRTAVGRTHHSPGSGHDPLRTSRLSMSDRRNVDLVQIDAPLRRLPYLRTGTFSGTEPRRSCRELGRSDGLPPVLVVLGLRHGLLRVTVSVLSLARRVRLGACQRAVIPRARSRAWQSVASRSFN